MVDVHQTMVRADFKLLVFSGLITSFSTGGIQRSFSSRICFVPTK